MLRDWLDLFDLQPGADCDAPLFGIFEEGGPSKERFRWLKTLATAALKAASGNPLASLHGLRHAAANRVCLALHGLTELSYWKQACSEDPHDRIRLTLLGRPGPTRRSTWAVGGFLGHSGTTTMLRSYLHFLGDWAGHLLGAGTTPAVLGRLKRVHRLDAYRDADPRPAALTIEVPAPRQATCSLLLRFLWILSRGKPWTDAVRLLNLDPRAGESMYKLMDGIGRKVRVHVSTSEDPQLEPGEKGRRITKGRDGKFHANRAVGYRDLLERLEGETWTRLMALAGEAEERARLPKPLEAPFTLTTILDMVGEVRQLLLWEERHFALVRGLIDYFQLRVRSVQGRVERA